MRCFVTGAGGFIGSHLAQALANAGHEVIAHVHYSGRDSNGWMDEVTGVDRIVRGDIRDTYHIEQEIMLAGPHIIYHLAALGSVPYSADSPDSFVQTNVAGTQNILNAARSYSCDRIIFMSSSEVYGSSITPFQDESHQIRPQSIYAASKIGAEALCKAYCDMCAARGGAPLDITIMRCFNTYGPRQSARAIIPSLISQVLDPDCKGIEVGNVDVCRDMMFVSDTVAALMAAGRSNVSELPAYAYNAGAGTAVYLVDLIQLIQDLTGIYKPLVYDEKRTRSEGMEVRSLRCDASAFTEATGWSARVPFIEGVKKTIEWWKARPSIRGGRFYK